MAGVDGCGAAMSSTPPERLWKGDEDVATPLRKRLRSADQRPFTS
jgi:hypothetical protein